MPHLCVKELEETNDELFQTVSNNEKQFFNGRENTRDFMIKYLKEKHGITEIDNKKISSYTSLYDILQELQYFHLIFHACVLLP